jgi:penicillin-binding protein 1A
MTSPRIRRIAFIGGGVVLGTALAGVLGLVGLFWYHGRDVSALDGRALREYRPAQVTRILARDGSTVIGEIFEERRTFIAYEDVPSHVENAFLAAEDADFYRHEGMDYFGMVRALLANVRAGEVRQGASTITQQVVKNFLLSPERTLERKVQELILARRLEQTLSKQEILELYLNDLYLGHGRYGIEEAARFYFGKSVRDIDVGQAALLATLPKAPGKASPFADPRRAKARQVYVLEQMAKHGFATPREVKRWIDAPLALGPAPAPDPGGPGADEFVDAVRATLEERYGPERMRTLGATVVTTVDLEVQRAARTALLEGLVAVDRRRGYGHGIAPAKPKNLERARAQGRAVPVVGQIYPVVIEARDAALGLPADGFPAALGERRVFVRVPPGSRYDDPELSTEAQFPAGGITMGRWLADADASLPAGWGLAEVGSGPEGVVLVAEVETGEVLAMVGGVDYSRGEFNRALAARRQPGSAFKPFVYGAALDSRRFTAASLVSDSPEIYEKWRPTNFERDVYRGDIRLREALTHSVNTVAIKLLDAVGVEAVHTFARAAGIESELASNLSLALGTSEITPFELLGAYSTLARGGTRRPSILIREIRLPDGETWRPESEPVQALSPEVVFVLTSMMQSVVEEGTGQIARRLGRPVAAKTGTSADARDAWFAGYTPRHAAVAWVGFDAPARMSKEAGGRTAGPIFVGAMKAAEREQPARPFVPPPGVSVRAIDRRSGLLAPTSVALADGTAGPPPPESLLEEYFVEGTEPIETAVPEAMPADEVLLGLYGESGAQDTDTGADEPATTGPDEPAGTGLPGVGDELGGP